jgi:hypothetical protein
MFRYFIEGGPLFMGILSIVFLAILVIAVVNAVHLVGNKSMSNVRYLRTEYIKTLGLFALVLGMLGQFIGLFSALDIISSGMEISPAIMAQGVKVSMITSVYGMIIFLVAYLLWFVLKLLAAKN